MSDDANLRAIEDEAAYFHSLETSRAIQLAVDEATEEVVEPLIALLFAVVHGHIGQNADGQEMIRLHPADYKRIKEAVEKE